MHSLVRQTLTYAALSLYGLMSVVGVGWHALSHDHSPSLENPVSGGCCHHGSHCHVDDEDEQQDHQNHPTHDDDSCLICQFIAQPQTNCEIPVVDSKSGLVEPAWILHGSQIAHWLPDAYESRGPPA